MTGAEFVNGRERPRRIIVRWLEHAKRGALLRRAELDCGHTRSVPAALYAKGDRIACHECHRAQVAK